MKKILLIIAVLVSFLYAQKCADEFSPQKFEESPSSFEDLVDMTPLGKVDNSFTFIKENDTFYKQNSYIKYKDYIYPTISGFWSYKKDTNGKIYEVNISQIESEIMTETSLTDMINSDFEDTWRK